MMEAVTRGGMDAGKPVAGFMILLEAGGAAASGARISPGNATRPLSSRAETRAGGRGRGRRPTEPRSSRFRRRRHSGEIFEVLALFQLRRVGSAHRFRSRSDYDGCFDSLIAFLEKDMVLYRSLGEDELVPHWRACATNEEAIVPREFLARSKKRVSFSETLFGRPSISRIEAAVVAVSALSSFSRSFRCDFISFRVSF